MRDRLRLRPRSHEEESAEARTLARQTRAVRRKQFIGLLIVALAAILWRLFHMNPDWIFTPGWWRF